jgi:hypothetical protein
MRSATSDEMRPEKGLARRVSMRTWCLIAVVEMEASEQLERWRRAKGKESTERPERGRQRTRRGYRTFYATVVAYPSPTSERHVTRGPSSDVKKPLRQAARSCSPPNHLTFPPTFPHPFTNLLNNGARMRECFPTALLLLLPYSGVGGRKRRDNKLTFSFRFDPPQQYNCGERTFAVSFRACAGLQKRSSGAEGGARGADESFRAASEPFPSLCNCLSLSIPYLNEAVRRWARGTVKKLLSSLSFDSFSSTTSRRGGVAVG